MIDVLCQRCNSKIGWRFEDARGVTIKCQSCGAKNAILPMSRSTAQVPATLGATFA